MITDIPFWLDKVTEPFRVLLLNSDYANNGPTKFARLICVIPPFLIYLGFRSLSPPAEQGTFDINIDRGCIQ